MLGLYVLVIGVWHSPTKRARYTRHHVLYDRLIIIHLGTFLPLLENKFVYSICVNYEVLAVPMTIRNAFVIHTSQDGLITFSI